MSNKSPIYLSISLILLFANAHATTYFVRSGASGNGTSWAKAWGDVSSISWSSLSAGDTVCVAGGTYSSGLTFAKSGTSGNPITIKRAVASDANCGSTTSGWSPSYDAQAVIGSITTNGSYVTVDGVVWNGFKINVPNSGSAMTSGVGTGSATNGITIRYVEIAGPCDGLADSTCQSAAPSGDPRGYSTGYWTGSNYLNQNNWLIQYNNIHGMCDGVYAIGATNWIIEHSRIADTISLPSNDGSYTCHDNFFITNGSTGVFRYNEVANWNVEGFLFWSTSSSWEIYGNVFHDPQPTSYNRLLETQNAVNTVKFYNNTVVNMTWTVCMNNPGSGGSWGGGTSLLNNLYYGNKFSDCASTDIDGEDYGYSDKALSEAHGQGKAPNPFLNYSAKTVAGYNLSGHTNAGLNLGSPYNADYNGHTRVNWDRGAFEYEPSSSPAPPSGLAAVVH